MKIMATLQRRIDQKEADDYRKCQRTLHNLLGDKLKKMVQRERYSATDALLTAGTKSTYTVEIKTTNKKCYLYDGFILRKDKYRRIMEDTEKRGNTEKPVIIYFADATGEYSIFNLRKIDENTRHGVKMLHKVEYDKTSPIVPTEVYFLDQKDASFNGLFT